jgi:3-oxoacyl-[acyl-carrier protein] reductase
MMVLLNDQEAASTVKPKVALVTGASRGIGRAIALRLGRDGVNVVVNYVSNAEAAQEVVLQLKSLGVKAAAIQADVGKLEDVRRLFSQTIEQFGGLDIVVNNVGTFVYKPLVTVTEEEFDRVFSVNAKGTFFALQEAAKHIRDGGRIINISTGGTAAPGAYGSVYAGSKAAIEQFGMALAKELGSRQITVNTVLPGVTETDGLTLPDAARAHLIHETTLGRLGKPDDVAEVVGFLASEAARWMTGQNVRAGGGLM